MSSEAFVDRPAQLGHQGKEGPDRRLRRDRKVQGGREGEREGRREGWKEETYS